MEKQAEMLKKALEMGANIEVYFHRTESEEVAKEILNTIAVPLELKFEKRASSYTTGILNFKSQIGVSAFYEQSKEEKIKLLKSELAKLEEETA